jgi:hypothetical protein
MPCGSSRRTAPAVPSQPLALQGSRHLGQHMVSMCCPSCAQPVLDIYTHSAPLAEDATLVFTTAWLIDIMRRQ